MVYGISQYSLVVGWESPRDDGGVEIDNYTLSLHQEDQTVVQTTTESLELPLSLDYSTVYSIIITANNCAGSSYPVSLTSMEGEFIRITFVFSLHLSLSSMEGVIIG